MGVFWGFLTKLRSFPKIRLSVSYPLNPLTSWLTLKPSYDLHFFKKNLLTFWLEFTVQLLTKNRGPIILFHFSCSFLPQAALELHKKHVSLESITGRSVNWHFSGALFFPNRNKTLNTWHTRSYTHFSKRTWVKILKRTWVTN